MSGAVLAQAPDVVWTRVLGGGSFDKGYCVEQTDDLGFIIVGETNSYGAGGSDVYLIKTDSLGLTEWARTIGGSEDDIGYCVQQTSDYGYIIAGMTRSFSVGSQDIYLIKTDASGYTLWTGTYGDLAHGEGKSVQQTGDNGYIIGGTTLGFEKALLIKTDGLGQAQWHNTYGSSSDCNYGNCVDQTSDGGYIISGYRTPYPYGEDWGIYIAKADASGWMSWDQILGGPESEVCYSGRQTLDGGYILGAYTSPFGDIRLFKTDIDGHEQWSHTYVNEGTDFCMDVQQTFEGGFIMVGQTNDVVLGYEAYIVRTDHNGNMTWNLTVGENNSDAGYSIKQIHDGGYIICGMCGGPWSWDIYLIRLAPDGVGVNDPGSSPLPTEFNVTQNFPNPFNPTTTISFDLTVASQVKLDVFDINGRCVGGVGFGESDLLPGSHTITFDGSHYIYRLQAGEYQASGKMVLMK